MLADTESNGATKAVQNNKYVPVIQGRLLTGEFNYKYNTVVCCGTTIAIIDLG